MMETREDIGDFTFWNYAENNVRIELKGATKYIPLTGSYTEDTKQLRIPYAHRLIKIVLYHTTSTNTEGNDNLDISLRRDPTNISGLPLMKDDLIDADDEKDPLIIITFGEGFEYEDTTWILGLAGETANDRVHFIAYIQRLGRRDK